MHETLRGDAASSRSRVSVVNVVSVGVHVIGTSAYFGT